ncbi:MAG: GNAT family N-acetyltransferase [Asticcacaulis sp.]|uniref:GNAT family N-acetyltransferase n=1 Tax=Asticcacaulis sp. TaxID=1872648 RepID=UPI0039E24718
MPSKRLRSVSSLNRIEILQVNDLTEADAGLWAAWRELRPELIGPYFDIRYVKAIGAVVPGARAARFYSEGQIAGYFAYQIRGGVLQPLGAPLSDYHTLIAAPGFTPDFNLLLEVAGAKRMDFQGWVGPMDPTAETAVLNRRAALTPEGFDAWYEHQDHEHHKFFKNVGRCERNIVKDFGGFDFTWERVTPEVMEWIVALKREQYKKTGLHDIFTCGWTRDVLISLASLPDEDYGLRAGVFRHEGKLVAAEISLMDRASVHLWFPAYDPAYYRYTVGIVLTMAIIRHLSPLGYTSFDFGTGGEDYKSPMTVSGGECLEGSLQYAPALSSRMVDLAVALLPARPQLEEARLSLRRRVNVIRSTEVSLGGWGRALMAMGQRAVMRLKPEKA